MKTMISCFLISLSTVITVLGQAPASALKNDADFMKSLAKTARYPMVARQAGKVAKVYVDFRIESTGQISHVNVLNEKTVDTSFADAVEQLMSKVPAQKSAYAGAYVLPVVFELEGQNGKTERPQNSAPVALVSEQTLLNEIVVVAYK